MYSGGLFLLTYAAKRMWRLQSSISVIHVVLSIIYAFKCFYVKLFPSVTVQGFLSEFVYLCTSFDGVTDISLYAGTIGYPPYLFLYL